MPDDPFDLDVAGAVRPVRGAPIPDAARAVAAAVAGGRKASLVWENDVGGLTFAVGDDAFIKWAPAGSGLDLAGEASRMAWARRYHPVPAPLASGADEAGAWLVTSALAGEYAVSARWKAEPATAVTAIGEGLRAMHEALPAAACPFSWSAQDRLADARRHAADGTLPRSVLHPVHQGLTIAEAVNLAAAIPPVDRLVVCHGDACAPNTLLAADGRWSGHVDLGLLGTADRWADLAVATWSIEWNYGPGWDGLFFSAYGTQPDPERTRYYRLLWDLSS